jgi:TPR repeat protein
MEWPQWGFLLWASGMDHWLGTMPDLNVGLCGCGLTINNILMPVEFKAYKINLRACTMEVRTTLVRLTLSLLLGSEAAVGADFNKGLDAYSSGDHQTALSEWEPLAENGNAKAQYNLGLLYRLGKSVSQNDRTAVKWYTLAAQQGSAEAQFNLGFMYDYGHGVPENDSTSVKWYTLAAEQGHAQAQSNLGVMNRLGEGVPQNDKVAIKWYTLAAAQGLADAQNNIGVMYYDGTGVPQNYELAVKWYTLAAQQGLAEAQLNLAHMLRLGRGVSIDYVRSYMWYNLSAYNNQQLDVTYKAEMAELMAYAEITKAQNMSSHCLRNNYMKC